VPKENMLLECIHDIEVDNVLSNNIGITIWDMASQHEEDFIVIALA